MTEQEWLECDDPRPMLEFLEQARRDRKLRLYKVACCRRVDKFLTDARSQTALQNAVRFADGLADESSLTPIDMMEDSEDGDAIAESARESWEVAAVAAREAARFVDVACPQDSTVAEARLSQMVACWTARAIGLSTLSSAILQQVGWDANIGWDRNMSALADADTSFIAAWLQADNDLAELLRHVIGNPFRPYPAPDFWPTHVVQLATAHYNGEDASPPLHDALLEAGHPELAEHFVEEKAHPKGCWVVDLLLGKE